MWGVWYQVMGATPDTVTTGSGGGNAADGVAYAGWVFNGSTLDAGIFDAAATTATGSSTNPNCASINTVTDGAWVLALAGSAVSDTSPGTVSGYTNQVSGNGNDNVDISTSGMTKLVASHGTEDPANYSSWSTGAWNAVTVALRPKATTPFNDARQAFINGMDSAQAEGTGWDAVVKAGLAVTDVVRTSDTVVTVTLPAFASYDITAQETITVTVPATILTGGSAVVGSPTFTVDTAAAGTNASIAATETKDAASVTAANWTTAQVAGVETKDAAAVTTT